MTGSYRNGRQRRALSRARIKPIGEAAQWRCLWLGGLALFSALMLSVAAAQAADAVTVHRGASTALEAGSGATVTEEGNVTVVRGPAVPITRVATATAPYPAIQQTPDFVPLRGFAGWFVDYKNNRFGNCFRLSTGEYLGYEILCTWRPLPY